MRSLVVALLCALLVAGCFHGDPAPPAPATGSPGGATPSPSPTSATPAPAFAPRFDGARALDLVKEQVRSPNGSLRYRVPATEGNEEVARWIAERLTGAGYAASWHFFNATYGCKALPMHNVVGERTGTSGRMVVIAAHYDTRPVADKDPDPAKRDQPIPGANDGASGVAVLLELARVLPPTDDTVRLVFFDGEDGGGYKGAQCTDWILGSRAYARDLPRNETSAIRAFVLVDMIGDAHLRIPREGYSRTGPGKEVLGDVFGAAKRLGHPQFVDADGPPIVDDHFPFVQAGVPAIDLIHLVEDGATFPEWHHTLHDDVDLVSAESLAAVGRTLEAWVADSA
jgi:hypothetical protein